MDCEVYKKIEQHIPLTTTEVVELLSTPTLTGQYYRLLQMANSQSRTLYGNRGYIFAQIGLNAEPCSVNCKFCSMGSSHFSLDNQHSKSAQQIINEIDDITATQCVSDLFLMTTADYSPNKFLEIGQMVRQRITPEVRLVANIGDFDHTYAKRLHEAGFTGAYHIVRLNEGTDTEVAPEQRMETISALRQAGLELYYCIEPIGPEHTYEQIANEIIRARDLRVEAMAAMRRISVRGTPLEHAGEISIPELCKIAAITALVVRPARSMNVHETSELSLIAGINQLYAETGANPRDTAAATESSRGLSVGRTTKLLNDYGLEIKLSRS